MRESTEVDSGTTTSDRELGAVAQTYGFWGRHPMLYRVLSAPTFLFRERLIRGRAVSQLRLVPGNRVLEVACGTGLNLSFLHDVVGEAGQIVGFDYSDEMLDAARATAEAWGWHNVQLFQGDAAELAIPFDEFDGILSVLGLSAIPRRLAALERIHALLRSGGRVSICDAQPFQGAWRALNPVIKPLYRRTARWDPEADIPAEIESVFGNVELEVFNGGSLYVASAEKR